MRDHVGEGLSESEWAEAKEQFPVGALVDGTVLAQLPMGIWITVGERLAGQIEVVSIVDKPGSLAKSDWPAIGSVVRARVLDHHPDGPRLRLSLKPSVVNKP